MLFRRLSERLVVECGEVATIQGSSRFVAFYVNANDFGDAFSHFPQQPTAGDEARLTCYANLCILADLLDVQAARSKHTDEEATEELLMRTRQWLMPPAYAPLLVGENQLERYRTVLEGIKWKFPEGDTTGFFPGYNELAQQRWLPAFFQWARQVCPWFANRPVLLFVDDFSTPRVSQAMQRVLNRLLLQRSPHFLGKLATEAASTFLPEDSSGKNLEDGDDYQLVDMGEESLFLPESERRAFLNEVFARRLSLDSRIPAEAASLTDLLGHTGLSKTEFARRLRVSLANQRKPDGTNVGRSQRRGRSRARVEYHGVEIFSNLWSGDTRTLIQLVTDIVDQASEDVPRASEARLQVPVARALQDRVFRNRGAEWLSAHTRNQPTYPERVKEGVTEIRRSQPEYSLRGDYGDHLKAVVEAFVSAARALLLGPTYEIREGAKPREVPRMAFRVEIVDEFRLSSLAQEIYRDLVRYGLFIRDSRGKSVRGAFVPRLFLRRLLLPYATLALSKRDSVQLTCADFITMLLQPDSFRARVPPRRRQRGDQGEQLALALRGETGRGLRNRDYDDLEGGG